jgi:hypothetical protein
MMKGRTGLFRAAAKLQPFAGGKIICEARPAGVPEIWPCDVVAWVHPPHACASTSATSLRNPSFCRPWDHGRRPFAGGRNAKLEKSNCPRASDPCCALWNLQIGEPRAGFRAFGRSEPVAEHAFQGHQEPEIRGQVGPLLIRVAGRGRRLPRSAYPKGRCPAWRYTCVASWKSL